MDKRMFFTPFGNIKYNLVIGRKKAIRRLKKECKDDFFYNFSESMFDGADGLCISYLDKNDTRSCLVYLDKGLDCDEALSVMCHEAVHVYQDMVGVINEDNPSSEFEAYSIQGIFFNLMSEYNRKVR